MSQIQCYYLEHTFVEPRVLAAVARTFKVNSSRDRAVLVTCQRIELYTHEVADVTLIPSSLAAQVRTCTGETAVRTRLAEVATGLHSQLLGERQIYSQVERCVKALPANTSLSDIGHSALEAAAITREAFGLDTREDYAPIVFGLFTNILEAFGTHAASDLVIVGGGAMARAIAVGAKAYGYPRVVIVTRSQKRLRQALRQSAPWATVVSATGLRGALREVPRIAFIATDCMDRDYRQTLFTALSGELLFGAVELSSVPVVRGLVGPGRSCLTMYDTEFLAGVERRNKEIAGSVSAIRYILQQNLSLLGLEPCDFTGCAEGVHG